MDQPRKRHRQERPPVRFSRAWFRRHRVGVSVAGGALVLLLGVGLFFALSGSGEAAKSDGADDAAIRDLVSGLPDATGDAKKFQGLFVGGAAPDDKQRARYRGLLFTPASDPSVSGDAATVKVRVRDDNSPGPLGELEWAFVKEGGKWKIKSAPLP